MKSVTDVRLQLTYLFFFFFVCLFVSFRFCDFHHFHQKQSLSNSLPWKSNSVSLNYILDGNFVSIFLNTTDVGLRELRGKGQRQRADNLLDRVGTPVRNKIRVSKTFCSWVLCLSMLCLLWVDARSTVIFLGVKSLFFFQVNFCLLFMMLSELEMDACTFFRSLPVSPICVVIWS